MSAWQSGTCYEKDYIRDPHLVFLLKVCQKHFPRTLNSQKRRFESVLQRLWQKFSWIRPLGCCHMIWISLKSKNWFRNSQKIGSRNVCPQQKLWLWWNFFSTHNFSNSVPFTNADTRPVTGSGVARLALTKTNVSWTLLRLALRLQLRFGLRNTVPKSALPTPKSSAKRSRTKPCPSFPVPKAHHWDLVSVGLPF